MRAYINLSIGRSLLERVLHVSRGPGNGAHVLEDVPGGRTITRSLFISAQDDEVRLLF